MVQTTQHKHLCYTITKGMLLSDDERKYICQWPLTDRPTEISNIWSEIGDVFNFLTYLCSNSSQYLVATAALGKREWYTFEVKVMGV